MKIQLEQLIKYTKIKIINKRQVLSDQFDYHLDREDQEAIEEVHEKCRIVVLIHYQYLVPYVINYLYELGAKPGDYEFIAIQ